MMFGTPNKVINKVLLCVLEGLVLTCSISQLSHMAGGYPTRFTCHRLRVSLGRVLFQRGLQFRVSIQRQRIPGRFPVRKVYSWLDSTVGLHWLRGNGEYKQFVGDGAKKSQEKEITGRHVPTEENP